MRILFVAERSAGHIFPALTLAKKFKKNHKVYFFLTNPFFKKILIKEDFYLCGKFFLFRNLFLEGFYRFIEAIYLLFKIRPHRIIGFGGRDSFFLILLGSLLGIKTAIYELNLNLGKANRILSFFSSNIFSVFKETIKGKKVKVIGVPLRENIKKIDRKEAQKFLNFDNLPTIMCLGGSSGSSFINKIFLKLIEELKEEFQIIHLTGEREYFEILPFYNKIKKRKFIKDFYYSMQTLYSIADLVICRAGASTLAEISYYQIPSILIPYPGADGHQKKNALYFKEKGTAIVFFEENFCFERFKNAVEELLFKSYLREKIINALKKIKSGISYEEIDNINFSFF
ncbi:MAG TPA: UDP-N-acetylglucosamine--N-acetylmuramyl-(pentapeptide) pyrophosphoryl-undecaprenol N-acetylglucosamine transferase [Candidatus Omnitrophica bacterium]|nr:UDP-N-acetylglucosamine--N-acetylmuramyl-(pentapeptide) pyrophosphoryl-undecaprenol N-acetylglucosamine transferase [Candidatus Omnitrophota bacterium]